MTKNGSMCRNYGEVLEENDDIVTYNHFCHIHKNQLMNMTWKNVRSRAHNMEWSTARMTHITHLLEHQLLSVKKEEFAQLNPERNYVWFTLQCAKHVPGFHRDWNANVFDASVKCLWGWLHMIGPVQVKIDDLHVMVSKSSWSSVAKQCPMNETTKPTWRKWLWSYFDTEEGKAHLFDKSLDDEIEEVQQALSQVPEEEIKVFQKQMELCKSVAKAKCRVRMNVIREDLVKTAWHPDRVMKWCFDEEDKDFLGFSYKNK
jgi:hypothetical protein